MTRPTCQRCGGHGVHQAERERGGSIEAAGLGVTHRLFGHPNFSLTRRSTGVYVATERKRRG